MQLWGGGSYRSMPCCGSTQGFVAPRSMIGCWIRIQVLRLLDPCMAARSGSGFCSLRFMFCCQIQIRVLQHQIHGWPPGPDPVCRSRAFGNWFQWPESHFRHIVRSPRPGTLTVANLRCLPCEQGWGGSQIHSCKTFLKADAGLYSLPTQSTGPEKPPTTVGVCEVTPVASDQVCTRGAAPLFF